MNPNSIKNSFNSVSSNPSSNSNQNTPNPNSNPHPIPINKLDHEKKKQTRKKRKLGLTETHDLITSTQPVNVKSTSIESGLPINPSQSALSTIPPTSSNQSPPRKKTKTQSKSKPITNHESASSTSNPSSAVTFDWSRFETSAMSLTPEQILAAYQPLTSRPKASKSTDPHPLSQTPARKRKTTSTPLDSVPSSSAPSTLSGPSAAIVAPPSSQPSTLSAPSAALLAPPSSQPSTLSAPSAAIVAPPSSQPSTLSAPSAAIVAPPSSQPLSFLNPSPDHNASNLTKLPPISPAVDSTYSATISVNKAIAQDKQSPNKARAKKSHKLKKITTDQTELPSSQPAVGTTAPNPGDSMNQPNQLQSEVSTVPSTQTTQLAPPTPQPELPSSENQPKSQPCISKSCVDLTPSAKKTTEQSNAGDSLTKTLPRKKPRRDPTKLDKSTPTLTERTPTSDSMTSKTVPITSVSVSETPIVPVTSTNPSEQNAQQISHIATSSSTCPTISSDALPHTTTVSNLQAPEATSLREPIAASPGKPIKKSTAKGKNKKPSMNESSPKSAPTASQPDAPSTQVDQVQSTQVPKDTISPEVVKPIGKQKKKTGKQPAAMPENDAISNLNKSTELQTVSTQGDLTTSEPGIVANPSPLKKPTEASKSTAESQMKNTKSTSVKEKAASKPKPKAKAKQQSAIRPANDVAPVIADCNDPSASGPVTLTVLSSLPKTKGKSKGVSEIANSSQGLKSPTTRNVKSTAPNSSSRESEPESDPTPQAEPLKAQNPTLPKLVPVVPQANSNNLAPSCSIPNPIPQDTPTTITKQPDVISNTTQLTRITSQTDKNKKHKKNEDESKSVKKMKTANSMVEKENKPPKAKRVGNLKRSKAKRHAELMRKENELEENNGVGRTDDRSAKGNDVVMVDATTVDKDLAVNKSGQIATNEPTDMNPSKLIGEWKITLSEENALPIQTLQRIWSVMNEAVQLGLAIPISIPNHTQKQDDLKQTTTDVQGENVETLQPVASGSPEACGSVTPALSQSQPQTKKASKSSIVPESVKEKNGVALTKNIKDLKGSEDTLPKKKVVINETESLGDQIRRLSSQLPKPSTRDLLDLEDDEEKEEEESRMSDEPEDEDEDPQDHPSLKRSNARRYDSSEEEDDDEEEEVLPLNSVAEVRPDHRNVVSGVALNPTIISTGVQEDDEEEDEQEETHSIPHPQEVPIVQSAIALPHTDIFTQRSPQRPDIQATQTAADMSSGVNQVNNSPPTFSKVESSQTVNAITNALEPEGEEGSGSLSDPGRIKASRRDLSSLTMTKDQSIDSARETSTSHDSSLSPVLTATQSSPRKVHNKMIKPSNITTTKSPKSKSLSQTDSIVQAKDDTLSRIQDSPIDSSERLSSHPPITTSRVQSSDEESGSEEETPNVMSTKLSNKLSSHHKFDSTMVGNHKPDSETDESSKSSDTDKDSSRNRTSQIESHIPIDTPQLESSSSSSDEDSSSDEEADEANPPPSAQKGKPSIQESFINFTHLSSRTQEMSQILKENRPRGTRRKTLNSFKPDDFEISVLNQHKVLYPINEPIESDCSESESESDSSSSDSSEEESEEEKEKERKAKENLNGLPISKMAGEGEEKRKRKRKSMIEIWKLESAKMKRK